MKTQTGTAAQTIQAAINKLEDLRGASRREPEDWIHDIRDDETGILLVVLHRTIDAQLAILTRAYNEQVMGRAEITAGQRRLARAILGE